MNTSEELELFILKAQLNEYEYYWNCKNYIPAKWKN